MYSTQTIYFIECRTGCSCCAYDNHYTGPYETYEIAASRKQHFWNVRRLASQYAYNGVYRICEATAETLPDGRIIADGHVYDGFVTNDEENLKSIY